MDRIDLGDNSVQFVVLPTDTLDTIHTMVTAYLNFRGWTLIGISGSTTTGAYFYATYASSTLSGGTKRIRLMYHTNGSTIRLGLAVSNETGNVVGLDASDTTDVNADVFFHVVKSTSTIHLYCFASPRWCYVTATRGNKNPKTYSVPVPFSSVTSYERYTRWDGSYGYSSYRNPVPFVFDGSAMWINGRIVGKNVSSYKGDETLLPSIYSYVNTRVDTGPGNSSFGSRTSAANMAFEKSGVTGCCELLDTDSANPFVYVDTCALLQRPEVDSEIEYAVFDALNMSKSQHGISTILEPVRGRGTVCLTLGDPREYSNLSLGKAALKFNGKNILQPIQVSNKAVGYNGVMHGILATQADIPTNFLNEVFLKVDQNYNLSDSGELRKFFVIPGYAKMTADFNRRRWLMDDWKETVQEAVYYGSVYEGTPIKAWERRSIGVYSNGGWTNVHGSFTVQQNDSFLIPA